MSPRRKARLPEGDNLAPAQNILIRSDKEKASTNMPLDQCDH